MPGGRGLDVARSEHAAIPGQTRVAGEEAQPRLGQPLLPLLRLREELEVAGAGEVGHVQRPLPPPTAGVREVWLAHRHEVRSESARSDFTQT